MISCRRRLRGTLLPPAILILLLAAVPTGADESTAGDSPTVADPSALASVDSVAAADLVPADSTAADSTAADSVAVDKGTTLIPLPVFFYTPETKTGFGGALVYYFRPGGARAAARPSTIASLLVYTEKKQLVAQTGADIYLPGDEYQLTIGGGGVKFPNTFWGLGNDSPEEAEEDYTPRVLEVSAEVRRRVSPGWYVGANASFADRKLEVTEEGGLLATKAVPGVDDGRVVQAGVVFARDTRDNIVAPAFGALHEIRVKLATDLLGSDYEYASWTIDSRTYRSVPGAAVLVTRALWMAADRTPPFDLLPQLGGESLLRGYYAGRYRDRALLAFQLEVRRHLWWRIGVVAFAGAGQVANDTGEFRLDAFRFAGGCGARFLVGKDEGVNLRADLGLGEGGSSGFYIGFGEIF